MKFLFYLSLISFFVATLWSCSNSTNDTRPASKRIDKIVADTINAAFLRDSSLFLTVEIGSQIWMKNDLQLTEFLNGDPISEARSNDEWIKFVKMKKPCFRKVGQSILYNGYVLNDERGLVP